MSKPILATDFKDDVMQEAMNGKRRYRMINNADGTVSFEDVTEYEQVGNSYGAGQINATNEAVNQSLDANKLVKDLDTISALTEEGYVPDALTIKQLNKSVGKGFQWYVDNGWLPAIPEEGEVPVNLEDCSWHMIHQLVQADTFKNYYKVGDTKSVTLSTGEVVYMQVASINDGSGDAGAWYPKGTVDFISKDCLQTRYQVNPSNTNAGGWGSCVLRNQLNTGILNSLPIEVTNVIKEKTHSYGLYGGTFSQTTDKLWLPTILELGQTSINAVIADRQNENIMYPLFLSKDLCIKRQGNNGSTIIWWTSSSITNGVDSFIAIGTDGTGRWNVTTANNFIPICFRVG